jgi:hypothetical protein
MVVLSVVVHDLYIEGIPFTPLKADSPLIVDPDAVLAKSPDHFLARYLRCLGP